jgi:hypothetical protein
MRIPPDVHPPGTVRRFSEQTRRELEGAAGADLGRGSALSVAFSIMTAPPGFDVVEGIITRARRERRDPCRFDWS